MNIYQILDAMDAWVEKNFGWVLLVCFFVCIFGLAAGLKDLNERSRCSIRDGRAEK